MATATATRNRISALEDKKRHQEGPVARILESQTSKIPSDAFLWTAVGAIGASLILQLSQKKEESLFVGQWVAPFLLIGIYNKMVKLMGSDARHK